MPEKDKKEITGGAVVLRSSDTFIQESVDALRSEAYGLSKQVIDVSDDDLLEPYSVTGALGRKDIENDGGVKKVDISNLSSKDSALALRFQKMRSAKRLDKKAA